MVQFQFKASRLGLIFLIVGCAGFLIPSAQTWSSSSWISYNNSANFPLFRKTFTVNKTIVSATAYVCGLGQHEFRVNGRKVGDNVLEPLWTAYNKKVFYVTYDVTSLLTQGTNALGVMLGNGFYNNDAAATGNRYYKYQGTYGPKKMILQLVIHYADGTSATVVSDASWRVGLSPITYSSVYGGEDYDARLEQPGWDTPDFTENAGWTAATVCPGPAGTLTAQYGQPIQVRQIYSPSAVTTLSANVFEYNLTQNFAGVPAIRVRCVDGKKIKLTFREEFSTYTQSPNNNVYAQYTCRGSGVETWFPRFFYYGFRFVKVEGASRDTTQTALPVILDVQGNEANAVTRSGGFSSSDTLWNKIHFIIDKAIEGNMQGVATDCPHREKLGWLEESHLLAPSIMYNYDVAQFYRKILDDMRDAQLANGMVPDIAPEFTVFSGGFRDSPEWGSAIVLGAWHAYQFYGDTAFLRDRYAPMKAYVDYLTSKSSGYLLNHGLGDWYGIDLSVAGMTQLVASSIYYYDVTVMRQAATILGNAADAAAWAALAANIKTAFNAKLFNASTNTYLTGNQTTSAMPLALGLVPDDNKAAVLARLVARVQSDGYRMQVGEIGFRFVLKALSDNDRSDVISQIASQTTSPSFGYLANSGRTTLSESMAGSSTGSQFHMMYGHLEEWFYYAALGIAPGAPGFAEIRFKPEVVGALKSATGYVQTRYGRTSASWTYANGVFDQRVVIPAGSTGRVYLPRVGFGIDSAVAYSGPTEIWRNGAVTGSAPGVVYDGTENNYLVWRVSSGSYHFTLGPPGTLPTAIGLRHAEAPVAARNFSILCGGARFQGDAGDVLAVKIVDLKGVVIRNLVVSPGDRQVFWDRKNGRGNTVRGGIYLAQLRGAGTVKTIKLKLD